MSRSRWLSGPRLVKRFLSPAARADPFPVAGVSVTSDEKRSHASRMHIPSRRRCRRDVLVEAEAVAEGVDDLHDLRVPWGRFDARPHVAIPGGGELPVKLIEARDADEDG